MLYSISPLTKDAKNNGGVSMTLQTQEMRKYSKGLKTLYQKGHPMSESVYFDFDKKEALVINPNLYSIASFPIQITADSDDEEQIDNFFVSMVPFIALCNSYPELTITKDREFITPSGERFKPANYDDDEYTVPRRYEDFSSEELDVQDAKMLSLATKFSLKDNEGAILYNTIVGTDKVSFYENTNLHKTYGQEYKISAFALALLNSIYAETIQIGKHDDYILMVVNDEFKFMCPEASCEIPSNYHSGDFMEKNKHESYIAVSKHELLSNLKFMEPFVANVVNERMSFKVTDNELVLYAKEEHIAEKHVALSEPNMDIPEDAEFFFSRSRIDNLINTIHDDIIHIHLNPDSPLIFMTGAENEDVNTICVRLVND